MDLNDVDAEESWTFFFWYCFFVGCFVCLYVRMLLCHFMNQGTIGCTPNSVPPIVFIVVSRDSWGL